MLLDDILLFDNHPSTAISHAQFDPFSLTVEITFRDGGSYSYPCSIDTWLAYQASDSRGGFFNENFR